MTSRLTERFAAFRQERRAGFVTFITAGDPDREASQQLLEALPAAGADIIELGMPFTDPMADGPAIQASSLRALKAGVTLPNTLDMVRKFRRTNTKTPIVLMGYFNPIHAYGVDRFLADAVAAGVDGLIIVDLPPEEDAMLCLPARRAGIDFIRLATPTTDAKRLPAVLQNASGFIYYVSIAGVTGTAEPDMMAVAAAVAQIKAASTLPIAVGFGIRSQTQAAAVAAIADAVVVGSALVGAIEKAANRDAGVAAVLNLVQDLASGVRSARKMAAE